MLWVEVADQPQREEDQISVILEGVVVKVEDVLFGGVEVQADLTVAGDGWVVPVG